MYRNDRLQNAKHQERSLVLSSLLLLILAHTEPVQGQALRSLLDSVPVPSSSYASLGPQPGQASGISIEALLNLWGPNLLPFGLQQQQALLNVLNQTILDINEDELQLLAVDELLPLSGPASVSVNGNRVNQSEVAPAPESSTPPAKSSSSGRRLLAQATEQSDEVLASAGNSTNINNLIHLELRVRIFAPAGEVPLVKQETIAAIDGPVLPMLVDQGINVTYIELKALIVNYSNAQSSSSQTASSSGLKSYAVALIAVAAVTVAGVLASSVMFLWLRRRRRLQRGQQNWSWKADSGSLTSVQADSLVDHAIDPHSSAMLHPAIGPPLGVLLTPLGSLNSSLASRSSRASSPGRLSYSTRSEGDLATNIWNVDFSELQFSRSIGEGSFGKVYLGKWRETTVAIKILNAPGPAPEDYWDQKDLTQLKETSWTPSPQKQSASEQLLLEDLRKEARLMAGLRHPNIVLFLGLSIKPPCLVTEFCARGTLQDVLHRGRLYPAVAAELGWRRRLALALDAAKGMLYLHSRQPPVLHRDLKSANLLVDKHWQAKVADFNLSRVMQSSAAISSLAATNPRWLPPEVLSGKGYNSSADVYAFGIILWELLTWQVPWQDDTPWQVVIYVVDHDERPHIPAEVDCPGGFPVAADHYLEVMRQCWARDTTHRPSFETIIGHMRELMDAEDRAAATRAAQGSEHLDPKASERPPTPC